MQRSSDDLPEPDRPIITRISPWLTNSEASWTATRLPVASNTASRPRPASSSCSARAGVGPKITSTWSNRTAVELAMSASLLSPAGAASALGRPGDPGLPRALLHDAVEPDRDDDDGQPGLDAERHVALR